MALVLDDRVKETSTTTGTGTLNLSGAVSGFQTFVAGVGDGNTTYYAIVNRDEDEWETGLGTVTDATTDTLARTTVIASSNSDSAVDFSAGTKDVFVTLPASKAAKLDASDNLIIGDGTDGTDFSLKFDGNAADGVITWMEDEDSFKVEDDLVMDSTKKLYFNDEGGEYISGDATDLTIASGAKINLTATSDVVIPANVGITFGTGEKIEGDSTDLTVTSGAKINLTATSDVVIPANVGITFGTGEKIEGDSTDLTVTSGAKINLTATSDVVIPSGVGIILDGSGNEKIESDGTDISISVGSGGDINIPSAIGITFGDDGEKIEGDGTDLTISGNTINLTATTDVALAVNTGLLFAGTEKIESDGTDLSITVGGGGDINIGSAIGVTFGDDGEKIEGDGTDLTIASSNLLNLTATTDIVIPTNVGLHFTDSAEKIESNGTDFTFNSGNDINLTATTDINVPANVGMTFGDDAEKIEGDGSDLTISGNTVNLDSSMNHTFSSTGKAMVLGF